MTTINFMNNANATDINAQLFEGVMNNAQKIGNKYFACIYTCLLASDTTYQRDDDVNPRKLKKLADNWEDDLCDPIQVSPHPEENKFYVYEGMHRTIVWRLQIWNLKHAARQKQDCLLSSMIVLIV